MKFVLAGAAALHAIGCSAAAMAANNGAFAELSPTKGNTTKGTVSFVQTGPGAMLVRAKFSGLTRGAHGFHIHEKGDCSADDASSAGGDYKTQPAGNSSARVACGVIRAQ